MCVNELTITGSDIGLTPGRRQAIIWRNVGIGLIGPVGTNFSEILIDIKTFSFCLGINILNVLMPLLAYLQGKGVFLMTSHWLKHNEISRLFALCSVLLWFGVSRYPITFRVNPSQPGLQVTKQKSMLNSMLVNKDFLTWLLIGWRLCCQPIRCQVWKSLLTIMDFNMEISK